MSILLPPDEKTLRRWRRDAHEMLEAHVSICDPCAKGEWCEKGYELERDKRKLEEMAGKSR